MALSNAQATVKRSPSPLQVSSSIQQWLPAGEWQFPASFAARRFIERTEAVFLSGEQKVPL